ncbi:MAG: hypothetical protein QOE97_1396 [Pseudonocardiales bacterium]|jgi:carbon monoxide dehydrogenase subunit G|nr:hypothetical protein [Pseudonocardiales bacterium]
MPEVEYATTVAAPVERVWDYVEDLNQWCHLMIGYQSLEIIDDRRSIWTLRGDVGILTREVRIQVDITEWIPRDRVMFVVTGISERLEGGGAFLMAREGDLAGESPGAHVPATLPARRNGIVRRMRFAIVRAMLRRLGRKAAKAHAARVEAAPPPSPARVAASSTESSRLTFQLRVSPLGPMAPMLDLLMSPMLEPAAQDLADGIRAAVER